MRSHFNRSRRQGRVLAVLLAGTIILPGCFRLNLGIGSLFPSNFMSGFGAAFENLLRKGYATFLVVRSLRGLEQSELLGLPGTTRLITGDDFAKELDAAKAVNPAVPSRRTFTIVGITGATGTPGPTPLKLEYFPNDGEWQQLRTNPELSALLEPPKAPDTDDVRFAVYLAADPACDSDLLRLEFVACYADAQGRAVQVCCAAADIVPRALVILPDQQPSSVVSER